MKELKAAVRVLALWAAFVTLVYVQIIERFTHPQLTETQMFLNYWPWWLVTIVFALIGALL